MKDTKYMCIECQKRPFHNQKRKLCLNCYAIFRVKNGPLRGSLDDESGEERIQVGTRREFMFASNYFTHKKWIHQPATFRFKNGDKYTPDFYDQQRDVFIEVSGTRQAFHKNKVKYDLFRENYPSFVLEIRKIDGSLLQQDKHGIYIWDDQKHNR